MEDIGRQQRGRAKGAHGDPVSDTMRLYSHDIRAAMSDVVGGLRLLDFDRVDPDTRAQLQRVLAAGETLAELVDAALMAAAGETLIHLDEEALVLDRYLTGVEMRWAGRAEAAGRRFLIDTDADLPDRVALPRLGLDRILSNLIHNAIRYGERGDVRLAVTLLHDDSLLFAVSDEGPGFSAAAMARLFTPLDRAEDHPLEGRGDGLGLHISKNIADRLGATLDVDDRPAGGARVTLQVPAAIWRGRLTDDADRTAPDLTGLRVLVAEDNETNQIIMRQLLQSLGAVPRIAKDGIEAMDALSRETFDIALIDIEMPRMPGLTLMRTIRALADERAQMPLVALTAYVLRDNREAIYAAGADGIIGKPVGSVAAFGRALLRHLGRTHPDTEAATALAEVADARPSFDPSQFEALLSIAGPDGAKELLDRLIEDLEAVSEALPAAVADAALHAIRSQTHILVSLAGAIGADRLSQLAEALNLAAHRGQDQDLAALLHACTADLGQLIEVVEARRRAFPG